MDQRRFVAVLIAMLPLVAACSLVDPYSEAKEAVRRLLKDPDSANFRDVRRCAKPGAIWGEVNSKNSYGAYAGFSSFIYADGVAAILADSPSSYDLDRWNELTRKCYSEEVLNQSSADGSIEQMADNLEAAADAAVREVEEATEAPSAVDRGDALTNPDAVPVCDREDSPEKFALMNEIGTDCLGE